MPYVLKPSKLFVKDPDGEGYLPQNVVTDASTEDQVASIEAAGAEQISAVQAKGAETLESIPESYTELSENVDDIQDEIATKVPDPPSNVGTYTLTATVTGSGVSYSWVSAG